MKDSKLIYSEPVREIMGNPPPRIVRTGTSVIFILFILFIIFTWFIRYPDTVPSPVEITTTNPPVTLVSKITGHIKNLYVKDREKVSEGQLIAIMETTASINEIEDLRQILDTMNHPGTVLLPDFSRLGEMQEYYSTCRKNHSDLISYNLNDYYGSKISAVNQEIAGIREYIKRLKVKEGYSSENLSIELKRYKRDSTLFAANIIPPSQLETSHQTWLKNRIELEQVRLDQSLKSMPRFSE